MAWAVQRGERWQARYRDKDGTTRSAGTWDTKQQAINAATIQETPEQLTWGDWEPTWRANRQVQESTRRVDEPRIEKHLKPQWEHVPLDQITRQAITEWVTELTNQMAAGSVRKLVGYLSSSMQAAMIAGHIHHNPARGIKLPKSDPAPDRYLNDDEIAALRQFLPEPWGLMFDLLLATGMRSGEAMGLHWEDVDLDRKLIRARWSWDRHGRTMKAPKSHAYRLVPVSDALATKLATRASQGTVPGNVTYAGSFTPHTGLVVGSLDDAGWRRAFQAAVNAAEIGNVRPHDLRHTRASRLVQAGATMQEVQKLLGHSSVTQTERYARLAPDYFEHIRGLME